jgi:hypothetical protein
MHLAEICTSSSIQNNKWSRSGAISRKTIVWLALPFVLAVIVLGGRSLVRHNHERARADWKTATIPRLAALSLTNKEISVEMETLKAMGGARDREWVTDHVLLMTNGECLFYAFHHGFNSGFVDDLFLAHSSDGRWLYSTYHFCNQMVGARFDDPPGSIAEFATTYSARAFDGKSDECLKHTWPVKKRP